ncbi:MAG: polysaccharide biosynthesis transport protein [Alphaproteobacteria bacterium]|jgi:uncharacterized protein involved in exopolysaccharide biosynthesis|nr:polysaccharide biosynthesis transport protein [Alphaproteobacteria bacterium]
MFQDPKSFTPSVPVSREALATRAPLPPSDRVQAPAAPERIQPAPVPERILTPQVREQLQALGLDLGFLGRRKKLIVASVASSVILGVLFSMVVMPRYRAVAQIMISPLELRVVEKALNQPAQTADANVIQVESETRVLTSDKVLRRVIERERLAQDPEFGSGALLGFTDFIPSLKVAIGLVSADQHASDESLAALRALQRKVTAKRTERTYVVDLMVDSNDPQKSARIANAIAQAFLEEQAAARTQAARRVTESLSSRLTELQSRVRRAEELAEKYKSENNIVGAGGRLVHEQQLAELTNQLIAAQGRTAETKSRYDQTVQQQRNGADNGNTSEAVQSNTVGRLREQYAAVARQEATLTAELGPRHPYVIEARAQVRNVQRLISEEIGRVGQANRIDYERALANENALSRRLDGLKRGALDTNMAFVKLRELEREVEASRAVYESFLARARETRELEHLDSANVRILSDAQPPRDRNWPPRLLIVLLGSLMLGGLGGCALAYLGERLKPTPRPLEYGAIPKQGPR